MTLEEIKALISQYGPNIRLQDLQDNLEKDLADLKKVLSNPLDGDQVMVLHYTWTFSRGKWSSSSWREEISPAEFQGVVNNGKLVSVRKMMPR